MGLILGLVIGIVIAVLAYFLQQQKIQQQEQLLNQLGKQIETTEKNYQSRLQETVSSLRADYQKQLQQTTQELNQQHTSHLQETVSSLQAEHENRLQTEKEQAKQEYEGRIQELENQIDAFSQASAISEQPTLIDHPISTQSTELETPPQIDNSIFEEAAQSLDTEPVSATQITSEETTSGVETAKIESETLPNPWDEELPTISEENEPESTEIENTTSEPEVESQAASNESKITEEKTPVSSSLNQLIDSIYNSDTNFRQQAATNIMEMVASGNINKEAQKAIPVLGKLSQDSDPSIRKIAIEALGNIQSSQVLPFIRQALRDTDSDVIKAASIAISKFKSYPVPDNNKLPKNAAKQIDFNL